VPSLCGYTFFNSKIAFNTTEEVITAYLMMGFSLQQLENIVRREILTGIDPRITAVGIATYRKAHGSAPDFIQLAYNHVPGNQRACEGEPLVPTHAGHYVQVDEFRFDYNFMREQRGLKRYLHLVALPSPSWPSTRTLNS
jgi:hypothetical protein